MSNSRLPSVRGRFCSVVEVRRDPLADQGEPRLCLECVTRAREGFVELADRRAQAPIGERRPAGGRADQVEGEPALVEVDDSLVEALGADGLAIMWNVRGKDRDGSRIGPLRMPFQLISNATRVDHQQGSVLMRMSGVGVLGEVGVQDLADTRFTTDNDRDNRAVVKAVCRDDLDLVGIAVRGPKNGVDKTFKGASLHP